MSDPTDYDLTELCDAAGVTVRTVRYYIAQGLLPSPGQAGPATRYGQGHLDRLRLIRKLQREHLPLAEIRRRLEPLSDAQVAELVGARPAPAPKRSALEYVRAVLEEGAAGAARDGRGTSSSAATRGRPSRSDRVGEAASAASAAFPLERAQWERLTLAQDIELHVRRPLSREQNRRLERLVEAARRIFLEEDPT